MPRALLYICLLMMPVIAIAQSSGDGVISADSLPGAQAKLKPEFHLTAGTSLFIMPKHGTTLGHFVAPEMSFRLSDKARISTGLMLSYNSINTFNTSATSEGRSFAPYYIPYTMRTTAYVAGEYDLTDKLTVTGSLFTDMMQFDMSGDSGLKMHNSITYGGTAGMRLKLSENAFIEAQVQIRHTTNPVYPALPSSTLTGNPYRRIGPWDSNW